MQEACRAVPQNRNSPEGDAVEETNVTQAYTLDPAATEVMSRTPVLFLLTLTVFSSQMLTITCMSKAKLHLAN